MESSALPDKIKIKLTELKIYKNMNIFYVSWNKIMQKHSKLHVFSLETSGNTLFHFDSYSVVQVIGNQFQRECYEVLLKYQGPQK